MGHINIFLKLSSEMHYPRLEKAKGHAIFLA